MPIAASGRGGWDPRGARPRRGSWEPQSGCGVSPPTFASRYLECQPGRCLHCRSVAASKVRTLSPLRQAKSLLRVAIRCEHNWPPGQLDQSVSSLTRTMRQILHQPLPPNSDRLAWPPFPLSASLPPALNCCGCT